MAMTEQIIWNRTPGEKIRLCNKVDQMLMYYLISIDTKVCRITRLRMCGEFQEFKGDTVKCRKILNLRQNGLAFSWHVESHL